MDQKTIQKLNDFQSFMSFRPTWAFKQFLRLPQDKICWFTGNQAGKTSGCIYSYVLRVFGSYPVPFKNVVYFECKNGHTYTRPSPWVGYDKVLHPDMIDGHCFMCETRDHMPKVVEFPKELRCNLCGEDVLIHHRQSQIFRFCSENLPTETEGKGIDSMETKNRTYPELKKWLPPFLVKKDLTYRSMTMVVKDPNSGCVFGSGDRLLQHMGRDIAFEFVSYSQSVQAGAGQQRLSVFLDEEPPQAFYEEQKPRLMAEEGDLVLALTPANRMSYAYDEFFLRGEVYVRTPAICNFLVAQKEAFADKKLLRYPKRKTGIAIIQSATDDNPTLKKRAIDSMLEYEDEDTIATRRYGIFRQATGRIFKDLDKSLHVIDGDRYFADGRLPHDWTHGRGIDVHPQTPWACGCASLSPTNEMFIWLAMNFPPDKYTTLDTLTEFYKACQDYKFSISLCDPEAQTIKKDTISIYDDFNRVTPVLKKEGVGTGGYWQVWNTKGEFGRDQIKLRLKNSLLVGRPFNNSILKDGQRVNLPTLWILKDARVAIEFMSKWSWEQRQRLDGQKDDKNIPQQKWSHMNMVWEALLKHPMFVPRGRQQIGDLRHEGKQYFRTERR